MSKTDKLIEAYNLLKNNCQEKECCEECVFFDYDNDECSFGTVPNEWNFCRYSKDEADLADILQNHGAISIVKVDGVACWKGQVNAEGELPRGLFSNLEEGEEIPIEEIAKYSER